MDKYYVYFFPERGKHSNSIKIGYSKDPIKRRAQLQVGHPHKIGCEGWLYVGTEEEAKAKEAELHEQFKKLKTRHNGEWFKWTTEIFDYLQSIKRSKEFTRYYE